jgi:hypothetical protein
MTAQAGAMAPSPRHSSDPHASFGIFNWFTPLPAAFTLVGYGLVFGAVFGLVVHALQRGRRDFASVRAMTPTRYEVVADDAVADEAKNLLAKMTGGV